MIGILHDFVFNFRKLDKSFEGAECLAPLRPFVQYSTGTDRAPLVQACDGQLLVYRGLCLSCSLPPSHL